MSAQDIKILSKESSISLRYEGYWVWLCDALTIWICICVLGERSERRAAGEWEQRATCHHRVETYHIRHEKFEWNKTGKLTMQRWEQQC